MKPRIKISQCLLGKNVRYNGGHCGHDWIIDQLVPHVSVTEVCPELEMGLSVPRPAMHMHTYKGEGKQLILSNDHSKNLTQNARDTSQRLVDSIGVIDGHILKKGSPSCGLERAKVYHNDSPMPTYDGRGFYADALVESCPNLPVIEEGRLFDPVQAELFTIHIFSHYRFRTGKIVDYKSLQLFHRKHKFLLMSQSPFDTQKMGRLASGINGGDFEAQKADYLQLMTFVFRKPISVSRRVNAVTHVYGMLKDLVSDNEKKFIIDAIDKFAEGLSSFATIITLLKFLIESHQNEYLKDQVITEPYPQTLKISS